MKPTRTQPSPRTALADVDLDEEAVFSVEGEERPLYRAGARTFGAGAAPPRLATGEAYDFVLDLPWQDPVAFSLPMPPPAELSTPLDGATIDVAQGLTVQWPGGPTDAVETVGVVFVGAFSSLVVGGPTGTGFSPAGVTGTVKASEGGIHVPFEELRRWFLDDLAPCLAAAECRDTAETSELTFPMEVEVYLSRSSLPTEVLGFAVGSSASASVEMARVRVLLEDPGDAMSGDGP